MRNISYEAILKLESGNWVYSNGKRFLVVEPHSNHPSKGPTDRGPTNKEAQEILTELRNEIWRKQ